MRKLLWWAVGLLLLGIAAGSCGSETPIAEHTADQAVASEPESTNKPEAEATATPTTAPTPTAVPAPTTTPTPTAVPAPSAEDRIAAVLAGVEAQGITGLVAWDMLETRMINDSWVGVIVCGWNGQTAFEAQYWSEWDTQVNEDGSLTAFELATNEYRGECVNTELVESALAFTRAYDQLREIEVARPGSPESLTLGRQLHTERFHEGFARVSIQRGKDNIWGILGSTAPLPESAVAPVLWSRTHTDDGSTRLEIVACREMNPDAGQYRGNVLLTDDKEGSIEGPHNLYRYELVPAPDTELRWRLNAIESSVWGDCFLTGDWIGLINKGLEGQTFEAMP